LLGLACNVGRHRARTDSLEPGTLGDTILVRAIRAHGNAAEYMPLALVILLLLDVSSALLHALGATFTIGRLAQA